ncbi:MAG: ABC transporter ATP-binding protein [Clostridium lundense]|nr:ABC transporter ATP-binding protein [Clostridium lundense]
MLEVKGIHKSYGKKEVLKNIKLRVEKGEIVCLLGKNGAGKTSLLNIISGVNMSDKGEVLINGYNIVTDSKKAKIHLGYVPDGIDIDNYLTGAEFLEFITDIYKIDNSSKIIKRYIELFEMEEHLNKLISKYSAGTERKIKIISCLIHNPDVIIMDEPTNGLDIDTRQSLLKEIKNLSKSKAILISTHDESIVEGLCHKVAIIREGEIREFDTIVGIKKKYAKNNIAEVFREVHRL